MMRLYYVGESQGPRTYVRSALGVDAERWNELFRDVRQWRLHLCERCGIPLERELRATELLPGRGQSTLDVKADRRLTSRRQGIKVLLSGLRRVEDAARRIGGVEVINVCLRKPDCERYEYVSLDRLLNRINATASSSGRHAFLIFHAGREGMITRAYRRLRVHNPVPDRRDPWGEGWTTRNIPIERVIGGPVFRSAGGDYLLQMAGLIAHALLMQEEAPVPRVGSLGIDGAFSILDRALNRRASRRDPQGIVRR